MTNKTVLNAAVTAALFIASTPVSSCKDRAKTYAENDAIFKNLDTTVKPGDDFLNTLTATGLKKIPSRLLILQVGNWKRS